MSELYAYVQLHHGGDAVDDAIAVVTCPSDAAPRPQPPLHHCGVIIVDYLTEAAAHAACEHPLFIDGVRVRVERLGATHLPSRHPPPPPPPAQPPAQRPGGLPAASRPPADPTSPPPPHPTTAPSVTPKRTPFYVYASGLPSMSASPRRMGSGGGSSLESYWQALMRAAGIPAVWAERLPLGPSGGAAVASSLMARLFLPTQTDLDQCVARVQHAQHVGQPLVPDYPKIQVLLSDAEVWRQRLHTVTESFTEVTSAVRELARQTEGKIGGYEDASGNLYLF